MKILLAEAAGFNPQALELLRRYSNVHIADHDRSGLLWAVRGIDVLWIRLRHRIDAEVIAAAPHLKVIVSATTGLNHIDLDEAERHAIRVISLHSEAEFLKDVRATAEHTVGLLLALLRHLPAATTHVQEGGWNRDLFKGRELYGKTVGIIGYGRLGRIVARYLSAFETRVLVTDPNLEMSGVEAGITPVPVSRLLHEADFVMLHVNLCRETRGFFGQEQFAAMKENAWFINSARGELVDEGALLEALRSGWLAGAALDVVCEERSEGMKDHPLVAYAREHSNLIITPHIGGCTLESMEKTELFLAQRLVTVLKVGQQA